MNNIKITHIDISRWLDYKNLFLEALKTEPTAFLTSFEEKINDSDSTWKEWAKKSIPNMLFCLDDNKPIGQVGYFIGSHLKEKHVATIWGMYVNPNYRGKKLGKQLLSQLIKEISINPEISKIKLGVNADQTAAYKLYTSLGFRKSGRLVSELKVGNKYYDEILMEKFLI